MDRDTRCEKGGDEALLQMVSPDFPGGSRAVLRQRMPGLRSACWLRDRQRCNDRNIRLSSRALLVPVEIAWVRGFVTFRLCSQPSSASIITHSHDVDVLDDADVEALYERELYEKDRIAARAARAERRTLRVRAFHGRGSAGGTNATVV